MQIGHKKPKKNGTHRFLKTSCASPSIQHQSGSDESERVRDDGKQKERKWSLIGSWSAFEVELKDHLVERIPAVLSFVLLLTVILVFISEFNPSSNQSHFDEHPFSLSILRNYRSSIPRRILLAYWYSAQPLDLVVPPLVLGPSACRWITKCSCYLESMRHGKRPATIHKRLLRVCKHLVV